MGNWSIRTYINDKDAALAFQLYKNTVGMSWPLVEDTFLEMIKTERPIGNVAIREGHPVGICYARHQGETGQILFLLVAPEYQRQGIGSALLKRTLQELQRKNTKSIHLGSGSGSYIWPGIPENLPGALDFFESHGFKIYEDSVDMAFPLDAYEGAPVSIYEKLPCNVDLHLATPEDCKEIVQVVQDNFADWLDGYQDLITNKQLDRILVASQDHKVVGVTMVEPDACMWNSRFDGTVGTIGAVGVAKCARGQGIGLALAAKATDLLKEQNLDHAYLSWTWLVDWYGKVGYRTWCTYKMAKRE